MNKITYSDRDLVRLLVPILADQFLAILVGLADSLMSAAVGSAAISAVSLVDSVSNLMIYIFSAMAAGGANAKMYELDPHIGFESFTVLVHRIIEQEGEGVRPEIGGVAGPVGEPRLDQLGHRGEGAAAEERGSRPEDGRPALSAVAVESQVREDREREEHQEMDDLVHGNAPQLIRHVLRLRETGEAQDGHGDEVQPEQDPGPLELPARHLRISSPKNSGRWKSGEGVPTGFQLRKCGWAVLSPHL